MSIPHGPEVSELLIRLDAWRTIADQSRQEAYVETLSYLMLKLELLRFDRPMEVRINELVANAVNDELESRVDLVIRTVDLIRAGS